MSGEHGNICRKLLSKLSSWTELQQTRLRPDEISHVDALWGYVSNLIKTSLRYQRDLPTVSLGGSDSGNSHL